MTIHAANCDVQATCQPGDVVNIKSESLEKAKFTTFQVKLASVKSIGLNFDAPLRTDVADPKVLSFIIPKDVPNGTYLIQVQGTTKSEVPERSGETPSPPTPITIADITPNQMIVERPNVAAMSPMAAYRDEQGINTLTVLGDGFRKDVSSFYFLTLKTPNQCAALPVNAPKVNCYDLTVDSSRQITLAFHSLDPSGDYYRGPHDFRLNVDGLDTNASSFALINHSKNLPITFALLGTALIFAFIFLLIYSGRESIKQTFGTKTYLNRALFLDVRTSSYSLSKCQFYVWTVASVLGYLFLAASKSYVQGSATFPDIPSGLPGILLGSAGTAVLATGIATINGNKGAGDPIPRFSDFVTTGGVVAADRLQFAAWTVVGVLTFLTIVFKTDPRHINDLPAIPSGFLEIMGISAVGYIGGKLARKAGPTLDAIAISSDKPTLASPGKPNYLRFQLTGSGLAQSASFSVDGELIFPDTIRGKDDNTKLPEILEQDPTNPNFARMLWFQVTQPRDSWFGGTAKHNFTITNPDGQRATQTFQIFKVSDVKITSANQTLAITGEFLDKNLRVEYAKPNEPGKFIPASSPQSPDASHYSAKVEANLKSPVTVKISDTAGVAVEEEVPVV